MAFQPLSKDGEGALTWIRKKERYVTTPGKGWKEVRWGRTPKLTPFSCQCMPETTAPSCQARWDGDQPSSGHTGEWSQPPKYLGWKESRRPSHSVMLQGAPVLQTSFPWGHWCGGEQGEKCHCQGIQTEQIYFYVFYICSFFLQYYLIKHILPPPQKRKRFEKYPSYRIIPFINEKTEPKEVNNWKSQRRCWSWGAGSRVRQISFSTSSCYS